MPIRKQSPSRRHVERVNQAEEIARQPSCAAVDVDEFNYHLPALIAASLLEVKGAVVSSLVSEHALEDYIQKAGDPEDPLVKDIVMLGFLNRAVLLRTGNLMAHNGYVGFKELGQGWSRSIQDQLSIAKYVNQWRKEDQAARSRSSRTRPVVDPEERTRELVSLYHADQEAVARAEFDEERRRYDSMSLEDQAGFAAYVKARSAWKPSDAGAPEPRPPKRGRKYAFVHLEYLVRGVSPFDAVEDDDEDEIDFLDDVDVEDEVANDHPVFAAQPEGSPVPVAPNTVPPVAEPKTLDLREVNKTLRELCGLPRDKAVPTSVHGISSARDWMRPSTSTTGASDYAIPFLGQFFRSQAGEAK
jgi:hypothetical protein